VTIYVAAIMLVAAVALFVAAPLTEGFLRRRRAGADDLELERLEHERALAVQGLRELEFDHEMGKIDDADYQSLRGPLERRALAAMSALEPARIEDHATTLRLASRRTKPVTAAAAPMRHANFCPQCGSRAGASHNFCAECGAALTIAARSATRAE
jgi:cytochrome c-type biogenesis protein CcmI